MRGREGVLGEGELMRVGTQPHVILGTKSMANRFRVRKFAVVTGESVTAHPQNAGYSLSDIFPTNVPGSRLFPCLSLWKEKYFGRKKVDHYSFFF